MLKDSDKNKITIESALDKLETFLYTLLDTQNTVIQGNLSLLFPLINLIRKKARSSVNSKELDSCKFQEQIQSIDSLSKGEGKNLGNTLFKIRNTLDEFKRSLESLKINPKAPVPAPISRTLPY